VGHLVSCDKEARRVNGLQKWDPPYGCDSSEVIRTVIFGFDLFILAFHFWSIIYLVYFGFPFLVHI